MGRFSGGALNAASVKEPVFTRAALNPAIARSTISATDHRDRAYQASNFEYQDGYQERDPQTEGAISLAPLYFGLATTGNVEEANEHAV